MPTYSKIVSVVRQIDTAHTFIGGTRKDITSGWVFVDGVRKQVFPSTENYTKVYENNTPGSYSTSLTWGKYKIVFSGAGGGGAAASWSHSGGTRYANAGSAGEQKTIYIDVGEYDTKTVSGIIGTGGDGADADISHPYEHPGTGSAGYQSGTNGQSYYGTSGNGLCVVCGGGGGGSSSLVVDGVLQEVAAGGNGGKSQYYTAVANGGTGGSGGVASGAGAAGGAGATSHEHHAWAGNGSAGYVQVYKSNLYPE